MASTSANLHTVWVESADAVHAYLRARTPYQQFLIEYVLAYHANVGRKGSSTASSRKSQYGAVLDLGCGPGQLGVLLSHHFDKVYARDVSEKMLATMRAIINGELSDDELREVGLEPPSRRAAFDIALGSGEATNVPDQSVDMIIMGSSAHWFDWATPESCHKIWTEWERILRPGGTVVFTGTRVSPGSYEGAEAVKTRPLRQMLADVNLRGPVAHYYNKSQAEVAASYYQRTPMPWHARGDSDAEQAAQRGWPQSMRLFTLFDTVFDFEPHELRDGVQSDPYPEYMPKNLERFVSAGDKPGDAYSTVDPRFKTFTPRKVAAWLRSASGYVQFFADHPDERILIGRDDDIAARQVKHICQETGLDYDATIELHHQTSFLGMVRA